jgi:hypothetical protein
MADYKTLKVTYAYNRVEYNELTLRYSYLPVSVQTNELDLVYSFDVSTGSSFDRLVGHWSDHTQIICNSLPFWHAGRQEETSNYQSFINSMSMSAEHIYDQFVSFRKNSFLDVVESDLAFSGFISDYPAIKSDASDRQSNNLLYNSDFSIPGRAISDYPCLWIVDRSTGAILSVDKDNGLSAGGALSIRTDTGEYAVIYQSYNARYPAGQDLVLSAMVNVPNNILYADSNSSGNAAMHIDVIYVDGSVDQSYVDIPISTTEEGVLDDNTTGQIAHWKRIHTSISLSKPSANIKCHIKSNCTNSTSSILFYSDCLQLENGTIPTRWKKYPGDVPPWLPASPQSYDIYSNDTSTYAQSPITLNSNTSYVNNRPKTKIYNSTTEDLFYDSAIPTRLRSISETINAGANLNIKGVVTNPHDILISNVEWKLDLADSSKIRKSSLELNDDHGSFAIAERDYFGDDTNKYTVIKDHMSSGAETYTLAIRAITIDHDYLIAFCRESLGAGVYYTFKFISPKRGPQGTYLECVQDFKVPDATANLFDTGVETGSTLFSQIGKVEGSRSKFVIETNDGVTKYETDFAYDYYINAGDGQFFTREKYDQICVT